MNNAFFTQWNSGDRPEQADEYECPDQALAEDHGLEPPAGHRGTAQKAVAATAKAAKAENCGVQGDLEHRSVEEDVGKVRVFKEQLLDHVSDREQEPGCDHQAHAKNLGSSK